MLATRSLILTCLFGVVLSLVEDRPYKNSKLEINEDRLQMITDGDDLSFFVLGDWGGLPTFPYNTLIEKGVSSTMNNLAKTHNTRFQVALGDNFYFDGVKNVDDKRFKETYEDVFNAEHLMDTPWFFILGNHDHYGNASAQISYMQKSKRWIFPSYNYSIAVKSQSAQRTLVKFLFIDTVLMCGNTGHDFVHTEPIFESSEAESASDSYFAGLERELQGISADEEVDYLFVAGHFPVWSIAEHGPTKCLVDRLRPLLHKYNVSAYLSGHDHNLQHIQDTYLDTKVDYILSGAANFIDSSTAHINKVPKNSLKFHYGDASGVVNGGFCLFKACEKNLTVTYYESNGLELYQTVLFPRD